MNAIKIEQDLLRLPDSLKYVGMALLQYVYSFTPPEFTKGKTDWVRKVPMNFVAFGFPKAGNKISMHLDVEYSDLDEKDLARLPLKAGHHYSKCEITAPIQLGSAVRYIEIAYRKRWRHLGVTVPPKV